MMKRISAMLLALGMVFVAALPVMAAIDVYEFESAEQERAFRDLTITLRCPKCQNNNIADSNAELAKDMRQKAFDLLSEGKSEQDVIDYMIARYGNFVTYDPPMTMSTVILWAGPLLFVLIGFTVLVTRSRKNGEKQTTVKLKADEEQRLKSLLEEMEQQPNNNGKVK